MDENDTKLTNLETSETENDKNNSNVILFSDYTPSDILGIVRVSPIEQFKTVRERRQFWDVGDRILVLMTFLNFGARH